MAEKKKKKKEREGEKSGEKKSHVIRSNAEDKRDRLTHSTRTQLSSSFFSSFSNLRKQAMVEEEEKMEGKVAPEKRSRGGEGERGQRGRGRDGPPKGKSKGGGGVPSPTPTTTFLLF